MKLNKNSKYLIASDLIYNVTALFAETFLVAYMFKITNENLTQISIYYIIVQALMGIGQVLIGGIIKNKPKLRTKLLSLGVIFRALFILFIAILGERMQSDFIIVAIFCGISETFYWGAHEAIFVDVTKNTSRQGYMSIKKSLGTIVSIVAPIILGSSIELYSFTQIAIYVFILSFIQIFITLKIKFDTVKESEKTKYDIIKYIKELRKSKDSNLKTYYKSNMIYGILEDPMSVLVTVITVMTFNTSLNLGILTTIFSICSIFALYLYKKYYNKNNCNVILAILSGLIFIGVIGLVIGINRFTLIIYNFAVTVGLSIFDSIFNAQKGDLIEKCNIEKWDVEHIMVNEFLISFSRVIGFVFILIVGLMNNIVALKVLLLIMAIIYPFYSKLVVKVEKNS